MPAEFGQRARRRFGQNFLTDTSVADRIAQACMLKPDDRVLEIGPGHGALTAPLLRYVERMTVIEVDRDLAAEMRDRYAQLEVIQSDALRVDYAELLSAGDWSVIGNLPYNISTPLLMRLLNARGLVRQMVFMLQQEVVDRMCAPHGSRTYGRLSVMIGYHCKAQALFGVSGGSFTPPPRVKSRVVRLTPTGAPPPPARFSEIVRRAFSQRRKTLRNALTGVIDAAGLSALGIDPVRRPETLSVDEFVMISKAVEKAPADALLRDSELNPQSAFAGVSP